MAATEVPGTEVHPGGRLRRYLVATTAHGLVTGLAAPRFWHLVSDHVSISFRQVVTASSSFHPSTFAAAIEGAWGACRASRAGAAARARAGTHTASDRCFCRIIVLDDDDDDSRSTQACRKRHRKRRRFRRLRDRRPPRAGPAGRKDTTSRPRRFTCSSNRPCRDPKLHCARQLTSCPATLDTRRPRACHPRAQTPLARRSPAGPPRLCSSGQGGGYNARGGRGSWSGPSPRQAPAPTTSPSAIGNGPSSIPTGPRANPSNTTPLSTSSAPKAFNPPTGPSSQHGGPGNVRLTLAQSMLATLPPIIPGGKIDPSLLPTTTGITRDIEPHYKRLKAEEEKARAELDAKQDKLRQSLQMWDKLEMESKAWKTRVDVSEQSLKSLAGEGMGGAAF
ncbi:uncharacterized protein N0V96_006695 [Colletotrichum fioriniae]|uniref:uncharacterized protein n=1 Tax=Colletotrichum fioriniae TaxID=710243 RepID=UPI0032DA7721|nr:hypothetical protein N0V96_006695 [Colletotrichum fioriniae]